MNQVVEEMQAILNGDELMHYGTKFHSGRYPYGSGDDPYQHQGDFLTRVERLRKEGWKETAENVKKEFGLGLEDYRNEISWANYTRRELNVSRAKNLKSKGMNTTEIGRQMGVNESTVRSWLNPKSESNMEAARQTADFLKKQVNEKKMIDVGVGVERELNISRTQLDRALYALESEGYKLYGGRIPQVTNLKGQQTTQQVLCVPGTKNSDIYDYSKVQTVKDYISRDGGETYEKKFTYPSSMDSKRLMIRYKDDVGADGAKGIEKDGIIELRRGVDDLSLGESRYAQVRILVDGTHYLKGMAVYSDDMPDGIDVVFNTNKDKSVPKNKVLKEISNDPDNPFGSLIKDADQGGQYWYTDKNGQKKLGLINKRADEGDWTDWKDALPSQFLSKQSRPLAKKQLDLAKMDKEAEFEDICNLTNPTVKKHLLKEFADNCDSAAVNLQAAALPGQKYHVIIPISSLKDNEIYAPGYEHGTKLALIRYPHAGTFEIPIVTVNNKNTVAKKVIGTDVIDAVGINSKVAERLSGADFDGDTVMCIPTHNGKVKITSTHPLKELEGFDPKVEYSTAGKTGVKLMSKGSIQREMGQISNLITDMTLAGAPEDEMARAVKHSMVVIDAYKHKLDYKKSEIDNGIDNLHEYYQGHYDEDGKWHKSGASTIISRAKGETTTLKKQGSPIIDPETGKQTYKVTSDLYYPEREFNKDTGIVTLRTTSGKKVQYDVKDPDATEYYKPIKKTNPDTGEIIYTNKSGDITYNTKIKTQKSTKMAETDDAYTLVSDARHPMELIYADYANSMKSLANRARKEMMSTKDIEYNKKAADTYKKEVSDLNAKLNTALLNATRERHAQRLANAEVESKKISNPKLEKKDIKKLSQQAITKYRQQVGSVSRAERSIKITDREWEAIQAGAINKTTLRKILNNSDIDSLRERATPRTYNTLSPTKINKAKMMKNSGYTLEQIAKACGCSVTTASKYLKGGN